MEVYIHPTSICESPSIGMGTRIWAFSHVMAGAEIGVKCNIGEHVFIESGVKIGRFVTIKNHVSLWTGVTIADGAFIGPAAVFTNDKRPRSRRSPEARIAQRYATDDWLMTTHVGKGASIGGGAVLLPGLVIGDYAMIGAGSVVTDDVAPHTVMIGNPAFRVGFACCCGHAVPDMATIPCEDCQGA